MSELLSAFHSIGDGVALVALMILAWAALFFVGPVLCAGLVLLRIAGQSVPDDAQYLFLGTAAAWALALVGSLVARGASATWRSMRAATAAEAARRGRSAADDMRAGRPVAGHRASRRPSAFSFTLRDPWVAWAAAEVARRRRAGTAQGRADHARGTSDHRHADPPPRAETPRSPPPRAPEPDPHAVLGVPRGASQEAVRKAYRELVKKHHPDRVTDRSAAVRKAAHQRILEIRRAFDALKDPARR